MGLVGAGRFPRSLREPAHLQIPFDPKFPVHLRLLSLRSPNHVYSGRPASNCDIASSIRATMSALGSSVAANIAESPTPSTAPAKARTAGSSPGPLGHGLRE